MKWMPITFLFMISIANAQASCLAVKKDLISLEYEIQNSQLNECSEGQTTLCRGNNPKADDHLKYADARNKYNEAIAKLIILRGIKSIAAAIEGSHSSLKALTPEKLDSAKGYIDRLELSLDQAELLNSALNPVPDKNDTNTNFWFQYAFSEDMSPEQFHKNIKDKCQLETGKKTKLCKYIATDKYQKKPKLQETLYGFAIADMQSRVSAASDPEDFYKAYKEKLQITDGNTKRSPSEFRQEHFKAGGDLSKVRALITKYETEKNQEKKKEAGLALKKLTVKLDGINIRYADIEELTANNKIVENLQSTFGKALEESKFDFATELSAGISANNLTKQLDNLEQDSHTFTPILEKKIESFLDKKDELENCQEDDTLITCLRNTCGAAKGSIACNGNSNLEGTEVTELLSSINTFEDIKASSPKLEKAEKCYDETTLAQKKVCLEKVQKELLPELATTSEAKLQQEVQAAKKLLDNFQTAAPFDNLLSQKSVLLAAIKDEDCVTKDHVEVKRFNLSCSNKNDFTQKSSAVKLGEDLEDIALRLTLDQAQELRGEKVAPGALTDLRRENFKAACQKAHKENRETYSLCQKYIIVATEENEDFAEEEYQNEEEEYFEEEYVEIRPTYKEFSRNYFKQEHSGILRGIKKGASNSFLPLIHAWGVYRVTKTQTKNQLRSIENAESIFLAQRDTLQRSVAFSDVTPINFNGGFVHNGFVYNSGFSASNSSFQNSNPFGFGFGNLATSGIPSIAPTIPNTVPTTSPTPGSGGTGFNFDVDV